MAALAADADIIFLSCGFFCLLSMYLFFLTYSQPSQIGCLPYFHTWCGLSANLGCRSETCCTRLAGNAGHKKSPKIRNLCTVAQLMSGYIFATKAHIDNQKKNLLNIIISSTCLHNMLNFSPLTAEICWRVWGTPAKAVVPC